jgi:hypothetical protein
MEQTKTEEVKTTGKVATTLKRRMATALTRTRFGSLTRGDCAMRTWPTLREGRSEDCSTSLVARIKTDPMMHRATKERAPRKCG